MRILLDTNCVVWWLIDRARFSRRALAALGDRANERCVSVATAWEIATKHRLGKLALAEPAVANLAEDLEEDGMTLLDLPFRVALLAGRLESPHRDPFDRLIAAHAKSAEMPVVTSDRAIADFGVDVIW